MTGRRPFSRVALWQLLLALLLTLGLSAFGLSPLFAQSSGEIRYLYDDLGRLIRVIDQTGECATYQYDAVGNILSITRSSNCLEAPSITAFAPTSGVLGETVCVTIDGTNLLGAAVTTDNPGIQLSQVQVDDTQIKACLIISFTARAGPTMVTVTTPGGAASQTFSVATASPTINALVPASGPPTRLVEIRGTAFDPVAGNNAVSFNGTPAAVLQASVLSLLTAVPAGATTGPVTVTVAGRVSNSVTFTVETPTGSPPTITSITPGVASVQGGGVIVIRGSGFTPGSQLLIDRRVVDDFSVLDSSTIRFVAPPRGEGAADVLVSNINGDAFAPGGLTYVASPPLNVVEITPPLGSPGIPTNASVAVLFSTPLNPATVTSSTFALISCVTQAPVSGSFSLDAGDTVAIFTSAAPLSPNACYTLTLTTGIQNVPGIPLNENVTGSFTTGSGIDTISPNVGVSPPNGATNVPRNSSIVFSFSEPVSPVTMIPGNLQVLNNGTSVAGALTLGQGNRVATFIANAPFAVNSTVTITLSSRVTDLAGNRIVGSSGVGSDLLSNFFVGASADFFPPRVLAVNPRDTAVGINVNSSVSVTFSKAINPATIDTRNFRLSAGGVSIAGSLSLSGGNTVATFNPDLLLPATTQIQVNVEQSVQDLSGNGLITPMRTTFTTAAAVDNVRPTVLALNPAEGSSAVPLNTEVSVIFSEAMDPLTLNASTMPFTFTTVVPLTSGFNSVTTQPVPGAYSVSATGTVVTFTPATNLVPNSSHTFRVTTGTRDTVGNPLLSERIASFTTTTRIDSAGPTIITVSPVPGATGVPLNARACVLFAEPLDPTSVGPETVVLAAGGSPIATEFSLFLANQVLCVRQANLVPLAANTTYVLTVTPGVTDVSGNPLSAPFSRFFTTGSSTDTTAPAVSSVNPVNNATGVSPAGVIQVTFTEPVDPTSAHLGTISLREGSIFGAVVPSTLTISADRRSLILTPVGGLFANHVYGLRVEANGVTDLAGNPITPLFTSGFTTGVAPGTDLNALPTVATVSVNPPSLFANGETTAVVAITDVSRNGIPAPNGTRIGVTAQPTPFASASIGGILEGGIPSAADPRFQVVTTFSGDATVTYRSLALDLTPKVTRTATVQVVSLDAADRPVALLGQATITLFRGQAATVTTNPASLIPNGTSVAEVTVLMQDINGDPMPPGTRFAITAESAFFTGSSGGTLSGAGCATDGFDPRFLICSVGRGGRATLTYTAPSLSLGTGQTRSAIIQVADVAADGTIVGIQGSATITLAANGFQSPEPVLLNLNVANGQTGVPVNTRFIAEFSQPLDPATVTASTVSLIQTTPCCPAVAGTRSLSSGSRGGPNSVVTFVPNGPLAANASHNFSVTTGIRSAGGNQLFQGLTVSFTTGVAEDLTAPEVVDQSPLDGAVGIPLNASVRVEFSEPMSPSTINSATFTVESGGGLVSGRVTVGSSPRGPNTIAVFTPDDFWAPSATFTVRLSSAISDSAGNPLGVDVVSSFATGLVADSVRPVALAIDPPNQSVDVPLNTELSVVFSESVDPTTLNAVNAPLTFTTSVPLTSGFNSVTTQTAPGAYSLSPDGTIMTFTPAVRLAPNTAHVLHLKTGVRDTAGNPLLPPPSQSEVTSSFTTSVRVDTAGPTILSVSPAPGATAVPLNARVCALASEALDPTTVMAESVILSPNGAPVPTEVTLLLINRVVCLRPTTLLLDPNTTYTLTLTTVLTDLAGNPLPSQFTSSFTTGTTSDSAAPLITSISPVNNATNVSPTASVQVTFNEPVDPTSAHLGTISLRDGSVFGAVVPSTLTISTDRRSLIITPVSGLFANRSYGLRVEPNGVTDLAGNPITTLFTSNFTTGVASGTVVGTLPLSATVSVNPPSLFADGDTTAVVTISGVNRNNILVPNGTRIGITAQPTSLLATTSAGGAIEGGATSTADSRFQIVSTLGGAATVTYRSPTLDLAQLATRTATVQVVSVDTADRPVALIGFASVTLYRGRAAIVTTNPVQLVPNGVSTSDVTVQLRDVNGDPMPLGTRFAITAEPAFLVDSAGGRLSGVGCALDGLDIRFLICSVGHDGSATIRYTAPSLPAGPTRNAIIQVADVAADGAILGILGSATITLTASGFQSPQPVLLSMNVATGQTGVALNTTLIAEFSQSLDPATVTGSTVQITRTTPCCTAVAGTLALTAGARGGPNSVVTFTPSVPLAANTSYNFGVTTGIRSATGNPLFQSVTISFTTSAISDVTAPSVININPFDGASGVPVNSVVKVEFSEPMSPSTITVATLLLETAGVSAAGRVSVLSGPRGLNTVAVFTPDDLLAANTIYTIRLATAIRDGAGNPLTSEVVTSFSTGQVSDEVRPFVTSFNPVNSAANVPVNTELTVTFSEPMDPSSLNASTIPVTASFRIPTFGFNTTQPVTGSYSLSANGTLLTFTPAVKLIPNASHTITVNTGARDTAGNPLLATVASSFTTGGKMDSTAPTVLMVSPAPGATDVPLNARACVLVSEPLDPTTLNVNTIDLTESGAQIPRQHTLFLNNQVVCQQPANLALLAANTSYTVTLTTGVTDIGGNALDARFDSSFTTGAAVDTTAPTVTAVTPANNATNVSPSTSVQITFSETFDPTTVHGGTVSLRGNSFFGIAVPATLSFSADRRTVTITPTTALFASHLYVVRVDRNGITDLAGNAATVDFAASFTTAVAPGTDPNLPVAAAVTLNPTSLLADGSATAAVTISSVVRSGGTVPNGTRIGVTAQPTTLASSVGGTIEGGVLSTTDPRFQIVTTTGGSATATYRSPALDLTPGQLSSAVVQVVAVDAEDRPVRLIGATSLTLFGPGSATVTSNPLQLKPQSSCSADVKAVIKGLTDPVSAGIRIAITADPVFFTSAGGTLVGPSCTVSSVDPRFIICRTDGAGNFTVTYIPPDFALSGSQTQTATIQTATVNAQDEITGFLGSGNITLQNSGQCAPQPPAAGVVGLSPAGGESGVGLNAKIVAVFSQSLNPATVTPSTFNVTYPVSGLGTQAVPGTVAVSAGPFGSNSVITFTPLNPLPPNTPHTITMTTGIQSSTGVPLASGFTSQFTTGVEDDDQAPAVAQVTPRAGTTAAPLNAVIQVELSEPAQAASLLSGFSVEEGGAPVSGQVTVGSGPRGPNTVATFKLSTLLPPNTTFTIRLPSTVADTAGNSLPAEFVSSFSTGADSDSTRPQIASVNPAANGTASASPVITVTFNEAVNPLTVNSQNMLLRLADVFLPIPTTITLSAFDSLVTLTPTVPLFPGRSYRIDVTQNVTDLAGNRLVNPFVSFFSVPLAPGTGAMPNGASLVINPPTLFADGRLPTTLSISNIFIGGTVAPNGTRVAITADPAFVSNSVGGVISGSSVGVSPDGRFILFETLGGRVNAFYTPPDLTGIARGATASGVVQVASVDADGRPSGVIAQGTTTIGGINSGTVAFNPAILPANGTSTSVITVTLRDRDGNLVPDGTPVALTAAPIFALNSAGGTITDGTASTADPRVKLFTTVSGQFTATYRSPSARGSGTAVIQVMTVDPQGRPTSLIVVGNITLQ